MKRRAALALATALVIEPAMANPVEFATFRDLPRREPPLQVAWGEDCKGPATLRHVPAEAGAERALVALRVRERSARLDDGRGMAPSY